MASQTKVTQECGVVRDTEGLDKILDLATKAQAEFGKLTQEQVDKIFLYASKAANQERVILAKMAVEEGGMGILEDKTIKNHFASEYVHNKYKDCKTCGIIERDESGGFAVYAEPIGVLAGIVPCTNPTSTTIFKCLLALKTRNCIVFSPHPRTARCTVEAARIVRDAAVAAGAPKNCVGWIDEPTVDLCNQLMRHPKTVMVVATGAGALVHAAYSSGKPAMGGGAGNTPVVIDETADIEQAVSSVLLSKTFDNGMICASEQAIIAVESVAEKIRDEFLKRGAYFLTEEEKEKIGNFILTPKGGLNPAAVGQPAWKLCELAGVTGHPTGCRLILGDLKEVGPSEKLSHEKLCPCLGFFVVKDFDEALDRARQMVEYDGWGHTSVLYTNMHDMKTKKERVSRFQDRMPTGRTLICMPTSQGAIGDVFNFRQMPSLSLGCGSWGHNATAEGLQLKHLLNYKQVCERREHILWFKVPPTIYFNRGTLIDAMRDVKNFGLGRAFIVTDPAMKSFGYVARLTDALQQYGIDFEIFAEVKPDPDDLTIMAGIERMKLYNPDHVIAFGGGSPMDAAKIMRLMYECPDVDLQSIYTRFMDIQKRVVKFPKLGSKVKKLICIPTTSGTGSEMTPFAVVTDSKTHVKYPIADYALTPEMTVVDADFVVTMPKMLASYTGIDAMTHALEAYVSMFSTDYSQGLAIKAIQLLFKHLGNSVNKGDEYARECCHNAASIAGMSFANAFLGICHSMAHQLGGVFHIPHGLANALLLCQVIKFNAEDAPSKQGTFPQYEYPKAKQQYAEVADAVGLTAGMDCKTADEKVDILVQAVVELKEECKIPDSIKAHGVDEKEYMDKVDEMALRAFDDQCTGTNPRYPLVMELRQLFIDAYFGTVRYLPLEVVHDLPARKNSLLEKIRS